MIKKCIFFIPILLMFQFISAQRYELGLQSGMANLVGDIGRTNFVLQKPFGDTTQYGLPFYVGIIYRMNFNPYQTLRFNLGYANIQFDDAFAKEQYRKDRLNIYGKNFSGTNSIYNIDAQFEYNFRPVNNEQKSMLSPYIFGGIGGIVYSKYNVVLNFTNYNFVDADGNGVIDNYPVYSADYNGRVSTSLKNTMAFSIPFGLGLKYKFSYNWALFGEFKFRYAFTNNLDYSNIQNKDVQVLYNRTELGRIMSNQEYNTIITPYVTDKQVGNPNSNDWVNTATIGITYSFGRPPCYCD